jgi:hypothetical protein
MRRCVSTSNAHSFLGFPNAITMVFLTGESSPLNFYGKIGHGGSHGGEDLYQRIGFVGENLQEIIDFHIKYGVFL